jgi:hypothetical protein
MDARLACPCCGNWLPPGPVAREDLAGLLLAAGGSPLFVRIVRRLAWRPGQAVSTADLIEHLYGDEPEGGPNDPRKVIMSIVHLHRNSLSDYGWSIGSRKWAGYWLKVQP